MTRTEQYLRGLGVPSYFKHNEARGQRPRLTADVLPPDFEPPQFSINGGMVVEERCSGCRQIVDRTTCYCGDPMNDNHVGHTPVPMGCTCHRTIPVGSVKLPRRTMQG